MNTSGDFQYNGVPIFEVGFDDFYMIYDALENKKRIMSKNIISENLQQYYKKSRENEFGICYQGVILDMRDFKK